MKNRTEETNKSSQTKRLLGWVTLPLRLFLGITFIYAGAQKLADPQYFHPSATRYIGNQIAAFATGSPIHGFLVNVAQPHAMFVGALVAYGELAIGIATLLGLLLRPAAFFGILLNTLFFLSATWRVYPYFYGSDIVFMFCWITLLVAGPVNSVLPTLDALLVSRLLTAAPPGWRTQLARILQFLLGVAPAPGQSEEPVAYEDSRKTIRNLHASRRTFIWGIVTGGAGMLGLVWLSSIFTQQPSNNTATIPGEVPTTTPGTPTAPGVIARVSQIPTNSAISFTISSNSDPGVLVHLNNGKFVAYDAVCTHAGCPVSYDPASKLLLCPCHGAAFDPAKAATVVQGPARTPLTSVPIHVDDATGTISLSS